MNPASLVEDTYMDYSIDLRNLPCTPADSFSFAALEKEFAKACPDYGKIDYYTASYTMAFSKTILYTVGPDAAKKKKQSKTTEDMWNFDFPVKDPNDPMKTEVYIVEVRSFICSAPPVQPTMKDKKLILSVQQAGLIAAMILSQLVPLSLAENANTIILSPLAGSVFCREDIKAIADRLNMKTEDVLIAIIQSCQTDGHYLPAAEAHVAAAAIMYTSRNITNKTKRSNLVRGIVGKYRQEVDLNKMDVYMKYAHGGLPPSAEKLLNHLLATMCKPDAQLSRGSD